MCDPVTITAVSLGLGAASAVAGAMSSQAAGAYQAQVARNNAQVAEWKGQADEAAKRLDTAQTLGRTRAIQAASGVDPNMGSTVDVQSGIAQTGELDALTIRWNAEQEAKGYRSQADMALREGRMGAITSLLSGATQVAKGAAGAYQAGVFK